MYTVAVTAWAIRPSRKRPCQRIYRPNAIVLTEFNEVRQGLLLPEAGVAALVEEDEEDVEQGLRGERLRLVGALRALHEERLQLAETLLGVEPAGHVLRAAAAGALPAGRHHGVGAGGGRHVRAAPAGPRAVGAARARGRGRHVAVTVRGGRRRRGTHHVADGGEKVVGVTARFVSITRL